MFLHQAAILKEFNKKKLVASPTGTVGAGGCFH